MEILSIPLHDNMAFVEKGRNSTPSNVRLDHALLISNESVAAPKPVALATPPLA
jgi:hypothetical protein